MKVRVGITTPGLLRELPAEDTPILVSANAFWRRDRRMFRPTFRQYAEGRRCALDSAGFVAMTLYGGEYPWTARQYADLGTAAPWDWWASMDYCVEPEVAADRATVVARIRKTTLRLAQLRAIASTPPMPVMQGWTGDDYAESARQIGIVLRGEWPALVGVGSVCRRHVYGEAGLLSVIEALHQALPEHVALHLFGVKSSALQHLSRWPRRFETDSCAYDFAARMDPAKAETGYTLAHRGRHLRRWYAKQHTQTRQQGLGI